MPFLFDPPAPATVTIEGRGDYPIRRIFCVGRNYAEHAAEMGNEVDRAAPFYFTKSPAHAVAGGDWTYPPGTSDLHHEVELVVALDEGGAVMAAGVGLDMTRRDLQAVAKEKRRPWDVAKDFEGAAILGQFLPLEEIGAHEISLSVNGAVRQSGNTRDLIHDIPALLAHLGTLYDLGAGDLIMTGTPAGVGKVTQGDLLSAQIEGLPPLEVRIV
ncbi:fumarylacetoacetate hydrolase family protein [Palleronia abyssalis]|uniref:Fumarylpyruvate hydrolase n=1 Tax=Palleronia abyssalis TaxID=1501240 RepID=A0A2R8BQE6_9RHOB|nr:fumarylacetoacetate hydrolase family protein [Palleronia abyssalis]SPJ22404.1 Fumarylpyruvate hydrolase [Palleronia abyssalis]